MRRSRLLRTESPQPPTLPPAPDGGAQALDWAALLRRWQGRLLRPASDARALAELGVGKQLAAGGRPLPLPAICLRPASETDVQRALEFLGGHGQRFAVRSGGHCFADLSSHAEVLLDLSELKRLDWDGHSLLRAGPGASAAEASAFLTARGRMLPTGGCPTVGLGGLALVGGFGLLGRRDGLVCDQLQSLRMVSVRGELLEVDAQRNADLFWALRGAGAGQFGVVTELRLRSQPAQAMNVLHGRWPLAQAATLIEIWQQLAPAADPRINLELGLVAGDDPEDAQDGPPVVELFGVVLAEGEQVPALLAPWQRALGSLAEPLCEWRLPAAAAASYLCGRLDRRCEPAWQPSQPYREHGYQFTKSGFFEQALPRPAIEAMLEHFAADRRHAQHRELEFIPWGGAYANVGAGTGRPECAFTHRAARFMVRHTAVVGARSSAALREHARAWARASREHIAAAGNGRVYQGYADPDLANWAQAYYGEALPRLREIKARHDPGGLMGHGQGIEAGAEAKEALGAAPVEGPPAAAPDRRNGLP